MSPAFSLLGFMASTTGVARTASTASVRGLSIDPNDHGIGLRVCHCKKSHTHKALFTTSDSVHCAVVPYRTQTGRTDSFNNKCIGDDTKAAARQSPICILKNKQINMAKNDFQYGGWNYCTLQCGRWLWDDMPRIRPKVRHIGILHLVSILTISLQSTLFCTSLRNFIRIGPPSAE